MRKPGCKLWDSELFPNNEHLPKILLPHLVPNLVQLLVRYHLNDIHHLPNNINLRHRQHSHQRKMYFPIAVYVLITKI